MRRGRVAAVLSVLLLAWLAIEPVTAPEARAAFPGTNGKIAFVRSAGGNSDIWVMDASGSNETRLTTNTATDDMPAWSPDGTKIAFTSNRAGNFEIYVMDADGSDVSRLTTSADSFDWEPSWSADGTKIAFTHDAPGEQAIYTVPAGGGSMTLLLDGAHAPAYSPDGTQIAYGDFESDDESGEIYVLTLATSHKQQITWNTHADTDPDWYPLGGMLAVSRFDTAGEGLANMEIWTVESHGYNEDRLVGPEAMWPAFSPDGTRLAYSGLAGGNWDIYSVGSSPGGTPVRLTDDPATDSNPDWQAAPDEPASRTQIAFTSGRDGDPEIFVMDEDGSDEEQLTSNGAMDDYPALSPDGQQIAFTSWRDGDAEVFVMDADGSNVEQITANGGYDAEPVWSPDGDWIMFASDRSGTMRLWFAMADGTMPFGPYGFPGPASNFSPDWSDQGVVMASDQDGDNELYTFIPDGTVTTQRTSDPASDYGPEWIPVGPDANFHPIVFVRGEPGDGDLWQTHLEGGTFPITETAAWEFSPTVRSDGMWMAFARAAPGQPATAQVWSMDAEGIEHQLTASPGGNWNPDWAACTQTCTPVTPAPVVHDRTLTLKMGDGVAKGLLECVDGSTRCSRGLEVKIQEKGQHGWRLVATAITKPNGHYEVNVQTPAGTYRALAARVEIGSNVCGKAISGTVDI